MGRLVITETSIAAPEQLFEVARDIRRYSEMVPALGELKVIECTDDGCCVKAEWTFMVRAMRITRDVVWIQDTRWDPAQKVCRFGLSPEYRGNLERMEGIWTISPADDGSEMVMDIDVGIKANVLPPRLAGLADTAVRRLNEEILRAVKERAEYNAARSA